MATFSERLTELRIEKGLNKSELARGIGMSRSAITSYENGSRDNPTSTVLKIIANFFGVSIDYLAGISGIRDPEINAATLADIFRKLSDNNKIELIKYARFVLTEQEADNG